MREKREGDALLFPLGPMVVGVRLPRPPPSAKRWPLVWKGLELCVETGASYKEAELPSRDSEAQAEFSKRAETRCGAGGALLSALRSALRKII